MKPPIAEPPSDEEPARSGGPAGASPGAIRLHNDPINILIVDDEPKNLVVLETVLDDPGYRLVRAETADQALLALVAKEFALLILDVRMPMMTGFELAHLIRQRKKTEQVPIIFLTAYYNEDQHVLEGYGTGAVDYLQKPVNSVILRSKVTVFADLHRKSRALAIANRAVVAEVTERRDTQARLRELNDTLEKRVAERTEALLERAKQEVAQRERLQASEEFNRSLMEGTADSVQVLDLEGGLLHLNGPAMVQLEVRDFAGFRGQDWTSLWPQESREMLQNAVAQARGGTVAAFTALRPTSIGTPKWWSVSVSPVRDSAIGQVVRILAVSRDVTEAREIEQALRRNDEQKDHFIATLAHELRNPLAPIRNAAALLRRMDVPDSQLKWCRDLIDRQVAQMTRLLEDLLDVSRITRSKLQLRRDVLDLASAVEQAVEIARPWIDAEDHTLETILPPESVWVHGDLTRLAQVISNLLINSAKYTAPQGQIRLSVHREHDDGLVSVKDNGVGIAAEDIKRIFEMFSQVPAGNHERHGGLGIGLSLARGLVEMHGGQLSASSRGLGQGSEFIVRLPTCNAPTSEHRPAQFTRANSASEGRCRILVVDDFHDNADSLAVLLQSMGHDVQISYGGEQAIEAAEEFLPDIAFIDLGMPTVDGYEVCRHIRAHPWGARMYLVAQTGWGQEFDRRRTQAAGFDQHMVKPLELEILEPLLRRIATRAAAN
jgi:PAS domain S-box-containing protein